MATSLALRSVVAILIGSNLIICIKTNVSSLANPETTEANVKPLSPEFFMPSLCELLSPDVFTQVDPFTYLRQKFMELPYRKKADMIEDADRGLTHNLMKGRFPSAYLPYAKLLASLWNCVFNLDEVSIFIRIIKRNKKPSQPWPDTSTLDSELSPLFSSDVFSDNKPPSVLIDKLLCIDETSFPNIAQRLRRPTDDVTLRFVNLYRWYSAQLSKFLLNEIALKPLESLKGYLAEIQQLKLSSG